MGFDGRGGGAYLQLRCQIQSCPIALCSPFSTPTLERFLEKNVHIAIKKVELHKMLYTLCRNLHEQTLSFAVADEIENPTL